MIASTPKPPYFAVIFTSARTEGDNGYGVMADEMVSLAKIQPGFLGIESAREGAEIGITVSYWESETAIRNWKQQARHLAAQRKGRADWYESYFTRVCKVERDYGFNRSRGEEKA